MNSPIPMATKPTVSAPRAPKRMRLNDERDLLRFLDGESAQQGLVQQVNIAVLAPMPRAREMMATAVKILDLASPRRVERRSFTKFSIPFLTSPVTMGFA